MNNPALKQPLDYGIDEPASSQNQPSAIPHPDPCYIITDTTGSTIMATIDRKVLVFTNKDDAESCLAANEESSCLQDSNKPDRSVKKIALLVRWNNLVDVCGKKFAEVLLDKKGSAKSCRTIPLRKDV